MYVALLYFYRAQLGTGSWHILLANFPRTKTLPTMDGDLTDPRPILKVEVPGRKQARRYLLLPRVGV